MIRRIAAVLACVVLFSGLTAQAAQPPAPNFTLTLEFKKQGKLDEITCSSFGGIDITSPHDVGSGQATGKPQLGTISCTKTIDGTSPQLVQAAANNEVLTAGELSLPMKAKDGTVTFGKLRIESGAVISVKQSGDDALGMRETVTFIFQKATLTVNGRAATISRQQNI